jgi:hypothetical protein
MKIKIHQQTRSTFYDLQVRIHKSGSSYNGSGSHNLINACFDAIKIAWLGSLARTEP